MKFLGAPMQIQNTDSGHWLVTCNDVVVSETESVSITIAVPRDNALTVPQIQRKAVEGAVSYLQGYLKHLPAE